MRGGRPDNGSKGVDVWSDVTGRMFSTIRSTMELFGNTQMLALGDDGEAFDLQVRGSP